MALGSVLSTTLTEQQRLTQAVRLARRSAAAMKRRLEGSEKIPVTALTAFAAEMRSAITQAAHVMNNPDVVQYLESQILTGDVDLPSQVDAAHQAAVAAMNQAVGMIPRHNDGNRTWLLLAYVDEGTTGVHYLTLEPRDPDCQTLAKRIQTLIDALS
jgi:hypothetical protein